MSEDDALKAQMALDGELDAANQIAFERELQRSPELAAEYARLLALRAAIRQHAPREAAPERLRARVAALAAPPASRARWVWPALAAALAIVAALVGYRVGSIGRDPELTALIAGYQRAALSGQQFDVASSDRHTVKPWLATRAPLGAAVPDLTAAGYPLLGGRVDIVNGRPAPTLVYRREQHFIAVTELPLAEAAQGSRAMDGYHVEPWSDAERAYVAVSDIDAPELADFVTAFRRASSP